MLLPDLSFQPDALQALLDCGDELIHFDGLQHVVIDAEIHGIEDVIGVACGREGDYPGSLLRL